MRFFTVGNRPRSQLCSGIQMPGIFPADPKKKHTMTINFDKQDCLDSIAFGLCRTGKWRKKIFAKHPEDIRNARAVDCLASIASEAKKATEIPDSMWSQLQPFFGFECPRWRESISTAARQVGFATTARDLPSFLNVLVNVCSTMSVAA
jgi:hypothetical protein